MLNSLIASYVVCADGGANRLRDFELREQARLTKNGRPRTSSNCYVCLLSI